MIKQLAHLCINSNDLEKTRWFYCDVLGGEVTFDFDKQGSLFGYYFKLGGNTFIEVFQGEPGDPNGAIKHLCLEVEDIDQVVAVLQKNGVEVTDKKLGGDNSWQAWTADPNGVRIEFHQYTETSMQRVGGTCAVTW